MSAKEHHGFERLLSIDLSEVLSEISVSYLSLHGETDANTSTKAIMTFINAIEKILLYTKISVKQLRRGCNELPGV